MAVKIGLTNSGFESRMNAEKNNSKDLLTRAYSLESDQDSKALYRDWAESYDESLMGGIIR